MNTSAFGLIVGLLLSLPAMSKEPSTKTLQTPDGPVTTTSTDVPVFPQQIEAADQEAVAAFSSNASQGTRFVSSYLPVVREPSLKDFDAAFRLWQREEKKRYTEDDVVEILGAVLGARLVAELNMEWVVVTDEYGVDFAVRSQEYEVLSFPFSSVVKRIEAHQYDFMVGVYHAVKTMISDGNHKKR